MTEKKDNNKTLSLLNLKNDDVLNSVRKKIDTKLQNLSDIEQGKKIVREFSKKEDSALHNQHSDESSSKNHAHKDAPANESELKDKTLARLCVAQSLYSLILNPQQDIAANLDATMGDSGVKRKKLKLFANELYRFTLQERESLEFIVKSNIKKYQSLDDMPTLLFAIVITGLGELLSDTEDTPSQIIISEYLNITKVFFTQREVSFINAILDKQAKLKNA